MYASMGVVHTIMRDLGVLSKFEEIPQKDKEIIINKCNELGKSFKSFKQFNDLSIIDEYIISLTEKK